VRPLYNAQFTLEPLDGRTHQEIAEELMAAIFSWIGSHYERSSETIPPCLDVGEITRSFDQPYQSKSESLPSGEFHRSLYWSHPADSPEEYNWTTLCDLAFAEGRLDFSFTLGVQARDVFSIPRDIRPSRPRLIPHLLGNPHWRCLRGAEELPLVQQQVTAMEVEGLCDVLFSPSRGIPVIVMSPITPRARRYAVNPRMLAERIAGSAEVIVARDVLTVEVLNQYLGSALSVPLDAVRVFLPGLEHSDASEMHWCFLGQTMRSKELTPHQFADLLFARIAERAVAGASESNALIAYRRISTERQRQRLLEVQQELKGERTAATELLDGAAEEIQGLKVAAASLNEQLRARDDRINALEYQLRSSELTLIELRRQAKGSEAQSATSICQDEIPRTVEAVVDCARSTLSHLLFLESALDSVQKVPKAFMFTERVQAALVALNTVFEEKNYDDERTGWRERFKKVGFDYKSKISDTARTRWEEDYTFLYEDRKVLFEEHFTIGNGSANSCLSIHFSTRLNPNKLVVAYVGRHLRNTLS
jgi:hypothetical protein